MFMVAVSFDLFIIPLTTGAPVPAQQRPDWSKALQLYREVLAGRRSLDSLTPEERAMVLAVHRALQRSAPSGATSECRDAYDRAEAAADDVVSYARRLISCVEGSDLRDDCSSEFSRLRSAHSDYESAVADVQSDCR